MTYRVLSFHPPKLGRLGTVELEWNIHQQLVLLEQWVEWQHVIVLGGLLSVTPLFEGYCIVLWEISAVSQGNVTEEIEGARPVNDVGCESLNIRFKRRVSVGILDITRIPDRFTFQNCCFRRGRERILMNIWKWHMYDFLLGNLSNRADTSPGGWRSFWSMNFSLDLILEVTSIITLNLAAVFFSRGGIYFGNFVLFFLGFFFFFWSPGSLVL